MNAIQVQVKELEGIEEGSEHIRIEPGIGIYFKGQPTIEEWLNAVKGIEKFHGMLQFYLGDLMVYAESPVTGWGQSKYSDLMEATGYDYNTLSIFSRVSRRFPIAFRRAILDNEENSTISSKVSFGHFQTVMPLGDIPAKHFLEMVRDGKWTVAKLREEVKKYGQLQAGLEPEGVVELPEGRKTFREMSKQAFKGYEPQRDADDGYDEVAYWLEVRDLADAQLKRLGVEA